LNSEGIGRILKGYSSFYYVSDGRDLWECRLRGRFRKEQQTVLAGDKVRFTVLDAEKRKGVVEEILPRSNALIRPAVANVDQALIVLAPADPAPDLWLLDRLLIMIRCEKIEPILCWNKEDLAAPADVELLKRIYDSAGILQVQTCALTGQGVPELIRLLKDRTTVLAGPSGVGKSSLLNQIEPGLTLKTGETSQKLGRGRHTTRHVEWLPLAFGGWVADTPGFSQIYLPEKVNRENLKAFYPDFERALFDCQFSSCSHVKEVQCGVKAAVEAGLIDGGRYQRYVSFMEELTQRDKRY